MLGECPGNQMDTTDVGVPTRSVVWTPPSATDNSGMVNLTSTHNPGALFDIGTSTVIYTSTDSSSNTVTCTFNVIITGKTSNTCSQFIPFTSLVLEIFGLKLYIFYDL